MPTPDPSVVTSSERLWSEEVGLARAGEAPGAERVPVYEWSSGRAMVDGAGPYGNNNQLPGKGSDGNP